jgi:DNA-binding beta-propeller fold protein YncE
VVAGGNGKENHSDQLHFPTNIFVDQNQSVYVFDWQNHRISKWIKDAKEGIVVAGGQGEGKSFAQLSSPRGIVVDQSNTVYIADTANNRIVR